MNINNPKLNIQSLGLESVFETYLTECEYSKQLRPQTLKSYREVFSTFLKILPEVSTIGDLHPYLMNEFYKRLGTRKRIVGRDTEKIGVKPSTISTYYSKLIAFFRWLETNNYVEKGSLSKKISKPPNPQYEDEKALSEMEVSKIITAITLNTMDNSFLFKRDMIIVMLLLYTGIRRGELLALRIQDVNFENRSLFINGRTSKSKKSRYIPLHFTLITHLRSYLKERQSRKSTSEQLIISSIKDQGLSQNGLKHWVKKYSKLSEVKFHIHRFRHTFACNLDREHADLISIMKVLGHSSVRMTLRYLRSITSEDARPFIEKLNF